MTKAEKRALEKYPAYKSVFDKYEKQRYAYICGYIQAEKDLELSWKDIKIIYRLVGVVADDLGVKAINTNIYQEALKRFKDFKERKEK